MLKTMKRIYRKNKNKNKDKKCKTETHGVFGYEVNNNDIIPADRSERLCSNPQTTSIDIKNNNYRNDNNAIRKKENTPNYSKSTSDLSRMYSPKQTSHKHLNRMKERECRSNTASMEMLRDNRLSVISQLDQYIDHVKKSIDEGNIAYAPNRLCCAQLLRTVYQKREQQRMYNSLHHRRPLDNERRCNSTSTLRYQQQILAASSLQNLKDTTSDILNVSNEGGRVKWKQGSDSESSSMYEYDKGSGENISLHSEYSDDPIVNCHSNEENDNSDSCSYDFQPDKNRTDYRRRGKSMPIYPLNDMDIY